MHIKDQTARFVLFDHWFTLSSGQQSSSIVNKAIGTLRINPYPCDFEWLMITKTLVARNKTLGNLRKLSFQTSLRSLRRLIWSDTFRFMQFFCLEQVYLSTKSNVVVKCHLGLVCTDCAGWFEMTLYANVPFRVLQAIYLTLSDYFICIFFGRNRRN